jgi:hypothetical protein
MKQDVNLHFSHFSSRPAAAAEIAGVGVAVHYVMRSAAGVFPGACWLGESPPLVIAVPAQNYITHTRARYQHTHRKHNTS